MSIICVGCKNENPRTYFRLFKNDLTVLENHFKQKNPSPLTGLEIGAINPMRFYTCHDCRIICLEIMEEKVKEIRLSFECEKE